MSNKIEIIKISRFGTVCDAGWCMLRNNGSGYCDNHYQTKMSRRRFIRGIGKAMTAPFRMMPALICWLFYIKPRITSAPVAFEPPNPSPTELGIYE